MLDSARDHELLNKAVRIARVPEKFRTAGEVDILSGLISQFDIFQKKVSQEQLPEVLRAAASNVKYMKVPMGQFLYHKDEPSRCIYFIIKGEAWKFRPKTESEIEREAKVVKEKKTQPSKTVPKILETIKLIKASKERDEMASRQQLDNAGAERSSHTALNGFTVTSLPTLPTLPSLQDNSQILEKLGIDHLDDSLDVSRSHETISNEKDCNGEDGIKVDAAQLKRNFHSIIKKIMNKRDVLHFENDYFLNLVKRNEELASKYIKDSLNIMRFEKKINPGETVGDLAMSLDYARKSSVLAYTNLYVLYLDQKGYENTFTNQIDEVREKVQFFVNYFKDVKPESLRRMCFFFKEQRYKIGDTVYKEGDSCDNLYFIKSGEIQLNKRIKTEESGEHVDTENHHVMIGKPGEGKKSTKTVIVASIIDGYFFGEEILVENSVRQFTAKAMSNLICYKISAKILAKLPKSMIRKLRDFSASKQTWRGNRLKDITNRSNSRLSTVVASAAKPTVDEKEQISSNNKQRHSLMAKTISLDRSAFKNCIIKRQRDGSTESKVKSYNDADEQGYRFKLQSKNNQEERNPYVLKFLPQDTNIKQQPLSLWKRNINHQRERKSFSRGTTSDHKSLSTSKDDRFDHSSNLKHTVQAFNTHTYTSENTKRGLDSRSFYLTRAATESSSNLIKSNASVTKDPSKHYFIKTLQTKFMKKFNQKKSILGVEDSDHASMTLSAKKSFTEIVQCLGNNKEEKKVRSLNDLKSKSQKSFKSSVRDTTTNNTSIVRSLTQLDLNNQIVSLPELSATQKSGVHEENSRASFTTFMATTALIKSFTIKKLSAKPQS